MMQIVVHPVSFMCSMAMSFFSVSFIHEGIEECVEGMLALGHQRVSDKGELKRLRA